MGRWIFQVIRSLWISFGIAILILVVLDGIVRAAFAIRDHRRLTRELGEMAVDVGSGAPSETAWAADYLRESIESDRLEWHPYVYWRRKAYKGRYINVDMAGIRHSWNSTVAPIPHQRRIFMFGGSTLWGTGARDEFTIPSLVSKRLGRQFPQSVWMTNFGETGYVSTQDVITLMLELRKGNVPDVVVFYGGINDTWSALQNGVAGFSSNEINRRLEFNQRDRLNWRRGFVERLALSRLIRGAGRAIAMSRAPSSGHTWLSNPGLLANSVVEVYLRNTDIVDSLASQFGFRPLYIWQPSLFTERRLTPREDEIYAQAEGWLSGAARLFGEVHQAFKKRMAVVKTDRVHDLSSIFNDDARTVFFDPFHLTEAGNDVIAEAVAQILEKVIRERPEVGAHR